MNTNSKDSAGAEDPALTVEVDRQIAEIRRGSIDILSAAELRRKLARSLEKHEPLRIKLGVDPTAHDLHLGFTVPLTKLRIFSDLGHRPVLIIGDATAMVGDPSGKNKTRPQLTRDMVDDFAQSYLKQAATILDMDKVEVRRNSEWLHELGFEGLIKLAAKATVAQLLVREDFAKRYADGTPIYLHEFIYPLMQGYDSVVVKSDVELGGQDQLFNLLIGRDLQRDAGQEEQVCLMGPLLVGLDGSRKMSKSYGNYIGISEVAKDMFGKVMSIPDELMRDYFTLATTMPLEQIEALLTAGRHPREVKDELARAIVTRFHDNATAQQASESFRREISEGQVPDDVPELEVGDILEDGSIGLIKLIVVAGFATSNGEARRLIKQGGVKLDGVAVTDEKSTVSPVEGQILKAGKRRYARLKI